jgi:hypothetical protein
MEPAQDDAAGERMSKLGRPRKRGRPKKAPGEPVDHKILPKMQVAISAIVEQNMPRAEAAKLAGLTDDAVRKAMRDNPTVRAFYTSELNKLKIFAKAQAFHALLKELTGPNAAARVAAARTLLEEAPQSSAGNGMAAIPGFTILISDGRAQAIAQQPIDVTPLNGLPMARVTTSGDQHDR